MQKNLVIVESPAKAKTIGKFLGKDFKVMSSYGHIRDLNPKDFSIDIEHGFEPNYIIPEDKQKIVAALRADAAKADKVWLASDEDREGEAISWHLYEVLGLTPENSSRIVFHEITKDAILHAVETPRTIDMNLVNAQQARRVLDRIVGFELSPVLWKKVKPALSAGRVQSVTVRLVIEREREIIAFNPEPFYRVRAIFILPDGKTHLDAELNTTFKSADEVKLFLENCISSSFKVTNITKVPSKRSPAPPFTTSTLQQEASRKLGLSVTRTMVVAQHLYEKGLITYMRTDSVNLSNLALGTAKETILATYGEKYYKFRRYHTKSLGAQEAHEAIRPTFIANATIEGDNDEQRLYELIRRRTLACQMADAELERTNIYVPVEGRKEQFVATGEVVRFNGFLSVYQEENEDDTNDSIEEEPLLPPVSVNDPLTREEITADERFTQHPPRYTEAALVRRLEELGIGRPSTYAPTIQTIQNRGYIVKNSEDAKERTVQLFILKSNKIEEKSRKESYGADRKKLVPTDIGYVVNDFLMTFFPTVMDYNFTANVEKDFDAIADGTLKWDEPIAKFYDMFHPIVEEVSTNRDTHKVGERKLGNDPKSGEPVYAKIGRYGPVIQIGDAHAEDDNYPKPRFAKVRGGLSIETITLEDALDLFKLPRTIGTFEDTEMIASVGRFGPYIRFGSLFVSIPKNLNPETINEEEAIELVKAKREAEIKRRIKTFDEDPDLLIMNGRFGPYITYKGKNFRIFDKKKDPHTLTLEDCRAIIDKADSKETKKTGTKTTAKKRSTTAKSAAAKKPAATKKASATKTAKTATKEPAAKKPAAKKTATKKAAAKTPKTK